MKKLLFSAAFIMGLLQLVPLQAQNTEQDTHYQNGRLLLDQKKYDLAMAELLPLTNAAANSPRAAEASYLYAVAAARANKTAEANAMLQQLMASFPEWGNLEEAYYLAAKIAFDQKNFEKAITNLQIVTSDFIKADADALERAYLLTLTDKTRFKNLLQQFSDDKVLAKTYADKLMAGWYAEEDLATFENIIRKFNLDASVYNVAKLKSGQKKPEYNVAVLLPFSLNADAATKRKNQFAADLYAGMKMAQDSLQKNNIKLNVFAYDAGSDTAEVRKTLQLPELKTMDLVVGPVYKATLKQASKFATATQINVINPLSDDLSAINSDPHLFLFESSITTQAQRAADFAYDNFEPKTAALIFENTKDDTLFARVYRKQFELRGGKVKLYKRINTKKNPNVMPIYQNVDLKTFGHLMVASDNLPAAVGTISQVENQNPKLPVITKESWLEFSQLSLNQLDELEVYFIYPKYINTATPSVRNFRRNYTSLYNVPPSDFAYTGFELLYRFGNLLNIYGPQFHTFLPQMGTVSGAFYPAFSYHTSRDNQFVPIMKLEDQLLILANPDVK